MPINLQPSNFKPVLPLILLHLLITLPLAYLLNIWADEASTLYTTQFGLSHALQHALADEKQAPLYFWFLSLWRGLNNSIFFARLFSIVCSCLAIKFFHDPARRIFGAKNAVWATAFFAVHPYLIWASLEIRVYSLVILLSVLLLNLFEKVNFRENFPAEIQNLPRRSGDGFDESNKHPFAFSAPVFFFTILSIIGLYTNYYLGFLLVGCFAALLVLRKWREAGIYLLQMTAAGAAFLPLIWTVKSQFAVNTSGFQTQPSIAEALRILWNFFLTFILPTEIFPADEQTVISMFRLWIVRLAILTVIFLFIKKRRRPNDKTIIFGVISIVITGFLFAAYFLIGGDYVGVRHASVLFAPFLLFTALVWREILPERNENLNDARNSGRENLTSKPHFFFFSQYFLKIILTAVVISFFVYAIYALYPQFVKRGDWARAAEFIEQNEQPNQPVIIFTTFDALALPYYYHGANQILPDERYFDFELEAEPGSPESWKHQTEFIISKIPADARAIWFLTNDKCEVKDSCATLENYLRANYTIIKEKRFYAETVRLLRKN